MNKLKSLLAHPPKTQKPARTAMVRAGFAYMSRAYFVLAVFFFGRYATMANTTSTAAEMI